jgi:hypothetical protein
MDGVYFLKERTRMIREYYATAPTHSLEIIRKITPQQAVRTK